MSAISAHNNQMGKTQTASHRGILTHILPQTLVLMLCIGSLMLTCCQKDNGSQKKPKQDIIRLNSTPIDINLYNTESALERRDAEAYTLAAYECTQLNIDYNSLSPEQQAWAMRLDSIYESLCRRDKEFEQAVDSAIVTAPMRYENSKFAERYNKANSALQAQDEKALAEAVYDIEKGYEYLEESKRELYHEFWHKYHATDMEFQFQFDKAYQKLTRH